MRVTGDDTLKEAIYLKKIQVTVNTRQMNSRPQVKDSLASDNRSVAFR